MVAFIRSRSSKSKQSLISLIKESSLIWKFSFPHFCSSGLKVEIWTAHTVFLLTESHWMKLLWRYIAADQQSHRPDADGSKCSSAFVYEEHIISETRSNLGSPKPAQVLLTNAADKCPSRWSRSTHTNHTGITPKAIELCFVMSARLLFKAAGQQLILIWVDGAGRTSTNQLVYSRQWVYEPLTLSTLKSLHWRKEIMSASESSLISTFDFFNWH